jgi:hypothetical protein
MLIIELHTTSDLVRLALDIKKFKVYLGLSGRKLSDYPIHMG